MHMSIECIVLRMLGSEHVVQLMHSYYATVPSFHCNIFVGIWGEKDIVLNIGVVHWWVVMYYASTLVIRVSNKNE